MAQTAIRTVIGGKSVNLKYMTVQDDGFINVDVFKCDDDFKPIGEPAQGVHEKDEVMYHKDLRTAAKERGEYVPEQSTNPEWD